MKRLYNTPDKMYTVAEAKSAFQHAYHIGKSPNEYDWEQAFTDWDKEVEENTSRELTFDAIIDAVMWQSGITRISITISGTKVADITRARQYICWFGYHYTNTNLEDMGKLTYAKTHSTVLHRARDVNKYISDDKRIQRDISAIKINLLLQGFNLNYEKERLCREESTLTIV